MWCDVNRWKDHRFNSRPPSLCHFFLHSPSRCQIAFKCATTEKHSSQHVASGHEKHDRYFKMCVCVILGFIFVLCCLDSLGIYIIFFCPQEKKLTCNICRIFVETCSQGDGEKCASWRERRCRSFFHVFIHTFVRSSVHSFNHEWMAFVCKQWARHT